MIQPPTHGLSNHKRGCFVYASQSPDDSYEARRARSKFSFLLHLTRSNKCPTSLTLVLYELHKILSNLTSGTIHRGIKRPMLYKLRTEWLPLRPLRTNAPRLMKANPRRSGGERVQLSERTTISSRETMLARISVIAFNISSTTLLFTTTRIVCKSPKPRRVSQLRAQNYYSP